MKEDKNKTAWIIEVGLYPGFLVGIRTYEEPDCVVHVLYLPFVDLALTIFK
jgi:hypothetical protein